MRGLLRSGKAQKQKAPTQQRNGQRGITHATLTRTSVPRFKHGQNYTWVLDAYIIANPLAEVDYSREVGFSEWTAGCHSSSAAADRGG